MTIKMMRDLYNFVIWNPIKNRIKLFLFQNKFRNTFSQTDLCPENVFNINRVFSVGGGTYGFFRVIEFGEMDQCKLKVGNYCSIGQEVTFILGGEHPIHKMSTFPYDKKIVHTSDSVRPQKGDIIIEDDVWIGFGATILSGVKIGQGAIIGAKSVVAKDIPPYSIYAGGKIIKYRFNEEIREKLMRLKYERLNTEMVLKYIELLEQDITENWFVDNPLYDELT